MLEYQNYAGLIKEAGSRTASFTGAALALGLGGILSSSAPKAIPKAAPQIVQKIARKAIPKAAPQTIPKATPRMVEDSPWGSGWKRSTPPRFEDKPKAYLKDMLRRSEYRVAEAERKAAAKAVKPTDWNHSPLHRLYNLIGKSGGPRGMAEQGKFLKSLWNDPKMYPSLGASGIPYPHHKPGLGPGELLNVWSARHVRPSDFFHPRPKLRSRIPGPDPRRIY